MLYGTDNAIMLDALRHLGDIARGVAVVGLKPGHRDLERLASAGVRGARAFMLEGGPYAWGGPAPSRVEHRAPSDGICTCKLTGGRSRMSRRCWAISPARS